MVKMAKVKQKAIKTPTGEWMYVSFRAHPEELASFQEVAGKLDRTVSWWVRDVLNREVARQRGEYETPNENLDQNLPVGLV
jgi:hypothetical protein